MSQTSLTKAPSGRWPLAFPIMVGVIVVCGVTFAGPLETALDRAPVAAFAGASFAVGGVIGWLWNRRKR